MTPPSALDFQPGKNLHCGARRRSFDVIYAPQRSATLKPGIAKFGCVALLGQSVGLFSTVLNWGIQENVAPIAFKAVGSVSDIGAG